MKDLDKKAFAGLLRLVITLTVLLFLSAWSLRYWQAWIFLAVFSLSSLMIGVYLMRNDPKLLERRTEASPFAEKERGQRVIQIFAMTGFLATIAFPAIDHRFAWSTVPPYVSIIGDLLVALGFLIIFSAFKENTFASRLIEVDPEQKVISTGSYARVRHPMYAGALVMLVGVPLALASWWGLLPVIPMTLVLIFRLLDEENFLVKNLAGYAEYRNTVRYRLIRFIW